MFDTLKGDNKMSKEFFITLNLRELDALRDTDGRVVHGYLFMKRNSNFSDGKTKKICYGALAGYITKIDRTQAKRTVQKLIQLGLLKATDTEQVFELCFCADTKNDTITSNTSNTLKKNLLHLQKKEEEKKSFLDKKEKGAAMTTPPQPSASSPSSSSKLTEGGKALQAFAVAQKWHYAGNPKSEIYFEQASEQIKTNNWAALELLNEFQESTEAKNPLGFQKFLTEKAKKKPFNPQSQYRGDLVL
ncbi:hypothetical protein B9Z37_00990 [Limnohabitans parvus II-B4]|uniref:Uncharacterized protein n=2 Tax=Limnohabitans TaxID=665874 RepID=A0A315EDL4_9BURK|nr:hypothetical protein B9Z37_00990 [Limnohabitans parvus II-B4]